MSTVECVPPRPKPRTFSDKVWYWGYVKARQIQIMTACSQLTLNMRIAYCTHRI